MKIVDTKKIFELNEEMDIKKIYHNNIVIGLEINNFYKNPDLIVSLTQNLCIPLDYQDPSNYPSFRSTQTYFLNNDYYRDLSKVIFQNLGVDKSFCKNNEFFADVSRSLIFNYNDRKLISNTAQKNIDNKRKLMPHTDIGFVNIMTYLTKTDKLTNMGTVLYKERNSNEFYLNSNENDVMLKNKIWNIDNVEMKFVDQHYNYLNSGDNQIVFDKIYTSKGNYNSCLMFFSRIFHHPEFDISDMEERLIQIDFLE